MKTVILIIQLLLTTTVVAQNIESQWVTTLGGNSQDRIRDIVVDARGDIYFALEFSGTISTETYQFTSVGNLDAAVVKVSPEGHIYWAQVIGSLDKDYIYGLALDLNGNVYATGGFSASVSVGNQVYTAIKGTDAYLVKINNAGDVEWFRTGGSENFDMGYSVTVDALGDLLLSGWFAGEISFDGTTITATNSNDAFLVKYTNSGDLVWLNSITGNGLEYIYSVKTDSDNNYYLAGHFDKTMGYADYSVSANGYFDAYLMKLNSSGEFVWNKVIGNTGNETVYSIEIDQDNNVYMAGYFVNRLEMDNISITGRGYDDGFVAKVNGEGSVLWATPVLSKGWAYTRDLAVKNNEVTSTGYFSSSATIGSFELTATSGEYDYEMFMTKMNSADGEVLHAQSFGGYNSDFSHAIATDVVGTGYDLAGEYYGDITLDGVTNSPLGSNDAMVFHVGEPVDVQQVVPEILASATKENNLISITFTGLNTNDIYFMSFTAEFDNKGAQYNGADITNANEHLFVDGMLSDSTIGFAVGKNNTQSNSIDGDFLTVYFEITDDFNTEFLFTFSDQKAENSSLETIFIEFNDTVSVEHNAMLALWPGDTNNDKKVNEQDVLALAYNWGISGSERTDQTVEWQQNAVLPWADTLATYSDTNGDGVVNHLDLKAIVYNFSKSADSAVQSTAKKGFDNKTTGGEIITKKAAGERFVIALNSYNDQQILGLTARLQIESVSSDDYKIVDVVYGNWAYAWSESNKVVEFNTVNNQEIVVAYAVQGRDDYAMVMANEQLLYVELEATTDWSSDATVHLKGINLTNSKGFSENKTKESNISTSSNLLGSNNDIEPERFELIGNYPNPFNPTTNITISVADKKEISVKVYNALGQEVKTLYSGIMNPGNHVLAFDASGLSSGTYIYQMIADGHVQTKKMTLIK